jgi:signal transduction histidine kinase
MNTLFLRTYLSALAFLLVTFFVVLFAANNFIYKDLLINSSHKIYQTISTSLKSKTEDTWQTEVKTYNALVPDFTLSLITKKDLSATEKEQLASIKINHVISDAYFGSTDLYALYALTDSDWILKIDEDNDSGDQAENIADSIIMFLLLMLPLAFALFLLVKKLTKPIQHLQNIAEKLGKGDLKARADNNLLPPMNTLASGFNTMAAQLEETLQEQQILIGAIPHELRSPLGRIRFALDMTRQHNTLESLHQDIEVIDGYVDEMQDTVDEILELNRMQNQTQVDKTKFDLCPLLGDLVKSQSNLSTELIFSYECNISTSVLGNAPLIKHAISNILDNAQKYAKTNISVTAHQINETTIIRIEDDGEGIDKDKIAQVFSPFATFDNSRNRKKGGIGLGLSIVKLIMKKHQGEVTVTQSTHSGACFELRW